MANINKDLLKNQYPGKYEVYLLSDLNGNPIYAGQGRCGYRARNWLRPSRYKKFGQPVKIKYLVIVETQIESVELEEKFIEKFNPPFNQAKRNKCVGHKRSEETRKKMSESRMGKTHSEETKAKMRKPKNRGK